MSIDPLDRKIGLISKGGVPGFFFFSLCGRRALNGFSPIAPLQIWFDPFSLEAGFPCIGLEDRREAVFARVHREERDRNIKGKRFYVRQHLSEVV